jgi:hypothetical protein
MVSFDQSMAQPQADRVSFWEIFKNSWKVLWERPKPMLQVVAAVTVLTMLFDLLGGRILGPFAVIIGEAMQGKYQVEEFRSVLLQAIETYGAFPLIAGKLVPWIAAPLANLTLACVALNLWDGYKVSFDDILFSARNYPAALYISILVTCLSIIVLAMIFLSSLPMGIVHGLGFGAKFPYPVFMFAALLGFGVSLFLFLKYVWPVLRRYLFLNYMAFFSLIDDQSGGWVNRLIGLFRQLHHFPRHMHQAIIIVLVLYLGLFLVLSIISIILFTLNLPMFLVTLITQFFYMIVATWLLVALSGFYRLCLMSVPTPTNSEPQD